MKTGQDGKQPEFPRRGGILLHPTSLPGPEGVGTLGAEAYRFVDFLADAGLKLWQILPLNPTGMGNSPYSSHSAFAGNALLISVDSLVQEGLLDTKDLEKRPRFGGERADYSGAGAFKNAVMDKAWRNFKAGSSRADGKAFRDFCSSHCAWLDDYALFSALKEHFDEKTWYEWPRDIASRKPEALRAVAGELVDRVEEIKFHQYLFFKQWGEIKEYANRKGIEIIGDIPIFVNHDSADVWVFPELFLMAEDGSLTEQSGVPPDPASGASQIWGNPLYNWEGMLEAGFDWWVRRFATALELADIVRIDHFFGFARCWHIPAGAETSEIGRWVESPGMELFQAVKAKLGRCPCIVEDLGWHTPLIDDLFNYTGFPGMRVLCLAFDSGPDNPHLPHNHIRHAVVYTGTHDNDTAVGWFRSQPDETKQRILRYFGTVEKDIHWALVRAAMASVAHTAVVPLQDILGLGSEARMNTPGTHSGQWEWRFPKGTLTDERATRLKADMSLYGR